MSFQFGKADSCTNFAVKKTRVFHIGESQLGPKLGKNQQMLLKNLEDDKPLIAWFIALSIG